MLVLSGSLTIFAYVIFLAGIYLFGKPFVHLWTGKVVNDMTLYFLLVFWSFLYSWGSCYSIFLNSIGKLKTQAVLLSIGAVLLFPLAEIMGKHYGVYGVCWSWIIILSIYAISNPIQCIMYIKEKKSKMYSDELRQKLVVLQKERGAL
jgi:O-antigen/teichoic acid export membrane protein